MVCSLGAARGMAVDTDFPGAQIYSLYLIWTYQTTGTTSSQRITHWPRQAVLRKMRAAVWTQNRKPRLPLIPPLIAQFRGGISHVDC
jgi:hypothetical protein